MTTRKIIGWILMAPALLCVLSLFGAVVGLIVYYCIQEPLVGLLVVISLSFVIGAYIESGSD